MAEQQEYTYTAVFPLVRHATSFVENTNCEGNYIVAGTLQRKGRTVTWKSTRAPLHSKGGASFYESYIWSMAERVGAYGSAPQGKKATIQCDDGRVYNCPAEY